MKTERVLIATEFLISHSDSFLLHRSGVANATTRISLVAVDQSGTLLPPERSKHSLAAHPWSQLSECQNNAIATVDRVLLQIFSTLFHSTTVPLKRLVDD